MPDAAESYRLLREECAIVRTKPMRLIQVAGADAIEWLQGQATQDVRPLAEGSPVDFCFCKPTGQIEAVCSAWRDGDFLFLATASECVDAVMHRFDTMVILEDVAAAVEERTSTSIWGPRADLGALASAPTSAVAKLTIDGLSVRAFRTRMGWDAWSRTSVDSSIGLAIAEATAAEAVRIEAGLPVWGNDIGPKTLPAEMGEAFEKRHVSYEKGCYVGQEVLMRMHARGRANWDWMGFVAESPIEVGAKVSTPDREDAGTITSVVISPRLGPIGAARVRREIAIDGQAVFIGGVQAVLKSFPM